MKTLKQGEVMVDIKTSLERIKAASVNLDSEFSASTKDGTDVTSLYRALNEIHNEIELLKEGIQKIEDSPIKLKSC